MLWTWQWIYSVDGGAEVVYQSGAGTVSPTSFSYTTAMVGRTYVWKLRVSDGQVSSESQLAMTVKPSPPPPGVLTFEAESGTVTSPFVISGGYISQSTETDITSGGRAAYSFTITNAGNYLIQFTVNAPSEAKNSVFVNIDAEPEDPAMIWHIPVTSGFESQVVSWQGAGTFDSPEFAPKPFYLTVGSHQLIVRGREAGVQLDSFSIYHQLPPPGNLRLSSN